MDILEVKTVPNLYKITHWLLDRVRGLAHDSVNRLIILWNCYLIYK